jgi:hypothetical protein
VHASSPEHLQLLYSFTSIKRGKLALEIAMKVGSLNRPLCIMPCMLARYNENSTHLFYRLGHLFENLNII